MQIDAFVAGYAAEQVFDGAAVSHELMGFHQAANPPRRQRQGWFWAETAVSGVCCLGILLRRLCLRRG